MTLPDEALVPIATAAELAGMTYNALYGCVLRGQVRHRRIGSRVLVYARDVEALAEKRGRSLPVAA